MLPLPGKALLLVGVVVLLTACSSWVKPHTEEPHNQLQQAASYNMQLGLGYLSQGDVERAKTKLNKALRQAPEDATIHSAMGYFYEKTSDFDLAEIEYRKALDLSPYSGEMLNNYGAFLCGRGNYKKAISYFMRAIQDQQYATTAQAYENAGLCALKIPDTALAVQYFEKAIKQDPARPAALLEMSSYHFDAGHYMLAKDYMERYKQEAEPTARSLWLDMRIAHQLNEKNRVASNALFLKNMFPNSSEYRAMQESGIQ